jgi:hypothetical protein
VNVTEPKRARAPGYQMGLTVLVDPQPEDYYYPLLASYGTKVKKDLLALFWHANHKCDTPEIDSFQNPVYVSTLNTGNIFISCDLQVFHINLITTSVIVTTK